MRANSDPCLYTRIKSDEYSAVAVYLDVIIVVSKDSVGVCKFINELKTEFSIEEFGTPGLYSALK